MRFYSTPPAKENSFITNDEWRNGWILALVNDCNDLQANDDLIIYDYGINGDMKLHVYKDEDFNPENSSDEFNIVRIFASKLINGIIMIVYETEDVHVNDGLTEELCKIWDKDKFHFALI